MKKIIKKKYYTFHYISNNYKQEVVEFIEKIFKNKNLREISNKEYLNSRTPFKEELKIFIDICCFHKTFDAIGISFKDPIIKKIIQAENKDIIIDYIKKKQKYFDILKESMLYPVTIFIISIFLCKTIINIYRVDYFSIFIYIFIFFQTKIFFLYNLFLKTVIEKYYQKYIDNDLFIQYLENKKTREFIEINTNIIIDKNNINNININNLKNQNIEQHKKFWNNIFNSIKIIKSIFIILPFLFSWWLFYRVFFVFTNIFSNI